ncbi:MAG: hypothetical protein FJX42_06570 [Alphaproteobacteria bacterium]|nr:hypothetical protein [Alphaproteobacteria bacterium]
MGAAFGAAFAATFAAGLAATFGAPLAGAFAAVLATTFGAPLVGAFAAVLAGALCLAGLDLGVLIVGLLPSSLGELGRQRKAFRRGIVVSESGANALRLGHAVRSI